MSSEAFSNPDPGDRVLDDGGDDELIVLDVHPDTRAGDHALEELGGLTVAEVNQECDPGAPVVDAVYADEAEAVLDGWRSVEDIVDAVEFDAIAAYTFPADRLEPAAGVEQ